MNACLRTLYRHAEETQALEGQLSKTLRMYQDQLRSTVRMATALNKPGGAEMGSPQCAAQQSSALHTLDAPDDTQPPNQDQVIAYAR